jgi:hypothetical protein
MGVKPMEVESCIRLNQCSSIVCSLPTIEGDNLVCGEVISSGAQVCLAKTEASMTGDRVVIPVAADFLGGPLAPSS